MRLKPKRKNFAWRQIWIDKQTYVVLASRDWSFRNEIMRTMVTTHLSYCDRPLARRSAPKPDGLRAGSRVPRGTIQPRYIPTGFVLDRVEVDGDWGSAQLVYSDGLYAISVFVGGIAGKSVERLCPGAVYDWGQGLMVATGVRDENVLVMGDLPAEEIEKIAGSVR
jgi:negative regulator of sigma E activity